MIKQLFQSQTKTVTFAALLLAGSSIVSALLGLVRDRLLAGRFGAGEELDVYFAAFRIPDFLYGILVMGGISVIFLPLFSEYVQNNKTDAWVFVNNLLHAFALLLFIFSFVVILFAPALMNLIVPGFEAEKKELAVALTRIMLFSPLLLGISSIFSGVLQYFNKFFIYSLAPVLYNLGIILGILFFVPVFGIKGLAFGVVLGALLHVLVQLPAVFGSGFHWKPTLAFRDATFQKAVKLAAPRTLAAISFHVNLVVLTAFASLFSAGSIAVFNFANNIQAFPIGIFGASFALASFPVLSRTFAQGNIEEFKKIFSQVFRQIIFLLLPIAAILLLLRAQIIRLIYGTGEFSWQDTRLTAAALGIFAFGVAFQALIPFLARVFFSVQDTKISTMISVATVGVNIAIAYIILELFAFSSEFGDMIRVALRLQGIEDIRIIALPIALVCSGIIQASLLVFFLRRKIGGVITREILSAFSKMALSTAALAIVVYIITNVYGNIFALRTFGEILGQIVLSVAGGVIAYLLASWALHSPELGSIFGALRKQFLRENYS